jgi:ABC-type sugar transport system permease subunit
MRGTATYEGMSQPPASKRPFSIRQWLGGSYSPYLFIAPFFIVFLAFSVYPLAYAFNLSFMYWHGGDTSYYVGLSNYLFLLSDPLFWQSLTNSVVLWVLIVPVQTLFSLLIAVLLTRPRLRLRWFFRTAFLTSFVVPIVAVAQIWLVMFDDQFGAINSILQLLHIAPIGWLTTAEWSKPTIALMVLWQGTGFAILIMLASLQNISQEYYEAASIDGAGPFDQFRYVTLPMMSRAISFFVVVRTLDIIKMFAEPFVLTKGGPYNSTTTAGYNLLNYINNSDMGTGAANSFLLMLLVVVVSLVMLRLMRPKEEV